MERIKAIELNALVQQRQETSITTTSSKLSLEKDTVILRWLRLAAQQNKEQMPGEDLVKFWLKSLSSFPLAAINDAFNDYLAHEVDEWGKAWMPKVPQIVDRCVQWCERNSGPPMQDLSSTMQEWRAEEKKNQDDPEWLKAYSDLKDHLKRLWPGAGKK